MNWLKKRSLFFKILLAFLLILVVISNAVFTLIDKEPYRNSSFYDKMTARLDSLDHVDFTRMPSDTLQIGWSKVSITPDTRLPLAGYGARDPKTMEGIYDSTFVRTVVFDNGHIRTALVAVDLLIVHPEVRKALTLMLRESDWDIHQVFFTATHTHAAFGGWAPGKVGSLFAGEFDQQIVDWVAAQIFSGILLADSSKGGGVIGYAELSVPDLIKNRLVGLEGITDPLLKLLVLQQDTLKGIHAFYGAHATCLDQNFRLLSGDYPAFFNSTLESQSDLDYAGFSAGAVGSMGPADNNLKQVEKAERLGGLLAEQTELLLMLGPPLQSIAGIRNYRLPIELRDPQLKVTRNLRIRPWVFRSFVGEYDPFLTILQINQHLIIGTPCDFSGELSVALHRYAREKGLNLIITSFNGDYIGYVTNDRWYDLDKYETRTMSWYGFDNGAYFSEVIKKIIDIHSRVPI